MVDCEIQLEGIWRLPEAPDLRQDFFLPSGSHDEIVDDGLELFLSDALLKDVLIVFHECVDVELHVETLQALVLLVPDCVGVVCDVDLGELSNQLADLFLVEDITDAALHSF